VLSPEKTGGEKQMKTRRILTLTAIAALVALVVVNTGRGTKPVEAKAPGTPTSKSLAAVDAPVAPAGIYATTITAGDIPPEFPPEAIPILVGTWQIELTEDGANIVSKDGDVVVVGHYTASPSRLVLKDEEGPLACFDAPGIATGIYNWSSQNDELTLSPVLDRCLGRLIVLTAHPLQKQ
jgi:hypothetical protein